MNNDRDKKEEQQAGRVEKDREHKQRSSAFKETSRGDKKSTINVEEEAGLEQERKKAMTERD